LLRRPSRLRRRLAALAPDAGQPPSLEPLQPGQQRRAADARRAAASWGALPSAEPPSFERLHAVPL